MSEVICKSSRSIRIDLSTNLGHPGEKNALKALNIARIGHFWAHFESKKATFFFMMMYQEFRMMTENVVEVAFESIRRGFG